MYTLAWANNTLLLKHTLPRTCASHKQQKAHSTSVGRKFMVPHNAFVGAELSVSSRLSETQRKSALKTNVLAAMESLENIGDPIVLYNDSDPVVYDPDGAWPFDEQTTVQQADGTMKTETTLDRPLGATPLLSSNIILPDCLCTEAFLDSKGNCVAVQLSALLKMPLERVQHEIDMLYIRCQNPNM